MSTENNYVREQKSAQNSDQKNEIRVTANKSARKYISYAIGLLEPAVLQQQLQMSNIQPSENNATETYDSVVLKAMGKAISQAVTIAEILKRRVKGLHQVTEVGSNEIQDTYIPKEEGLEKIVKTRNVSFITITLSKKPVNVDHLGYQAPIPEDEVQEPQPIQNSRPRRGRGGLRGRGRGGRGRGGFRGRGRGRGGFRGGRGRRGGFRRGRGGFRGRGRGRGASAEEVVEVVEVVPQQE